MAMAWEPDEKIATHLPRIAVLLGGFSKYDEYRNPIAISEAGSRLFKAVELFNQKKIDTIIISGGAASLTGQIRPEAVYAKQYLMDLGIKYKCIFVDSTSKNTHENAVNSKKILDKLGYTQEVLLITSAYHMRRSISTFKRADIKVIPYSVQYISNPNRGYKINDFLLPSSEALFHFDALIKEWVGFCVYKITGKG